MRGLQIKIKIKNPRWLIFVRKPKTEAKVSRNSWNWSRREKISLRSPITNPPASNETRRRSPTSSIPNPNVSAAKGGLFLLFHYDLISFVFEFFSILFFFLKVFCFAGFSKGSERQGDYSRCPPPESHSGEGAPQLHQARLRRRPLHPGPLSSLVSMKSKQSCKL